jgi:hypothetical protein
MTGFMVRPLAIAVLCMMASMPDAYAAPDTFDTTQRQQILTGISTALNEYIYPGVAAKVRTALSADTARLVAIDDPLKFAKAVSDDMRTSGDDKHLNLVYSPDTFAPDTDPTPAEIAHDNMQTLLHNAGVRDAQWLPGNIGYIRISGFPSDSAQVRRTIDGAMATVAHTDALIIDLRHNGGGDPSSLDYWMGYFFEKSTELTQIHWMTPKPHVDRQWSAAKVAGPRYLKPIYVLTSAHTFSCAEQFAYDLKALHRATMVGENTGGGANPGDFHRLTEHFAVFIPTGRAYNPYTKTNWEHTGITPDVATKPEDALVGAYTAALKSDTDNFDTIAAERKQILGDPAAALRIVFTP